MNTPLIVISNGMPKSGSTVLCDHTRALIARLYPENGLKAMCKAVASGKLDGIAPGGGTLSAPAFIKAFGDRELDIISEIAASEGPLVVKTHVNTNPALLEALRQDRVRMTFTHRDPRDMILSAMDHCIQTRNSDDPSLQEFTSLRTGVVSARDWWVPRSCNWVESGLAHVILYTDIVSMPAHVLERMAGYLGIPAEPGLLNEIIENERASRKFGRFHFNRGELRRYPNEMSGEDIALCNRELGDLITRLGYEL